MALGLMVRGDVFLVTEKSRTLLHAPFIYWAGGEKDEQESKIQEGSSWQSFPGSERENCWIVGEGERFARMVKGVAEVFDNRNYHSIEESDMQKLYQIFNRLHSCFLRMDVLEKYRLPVLMEEFIAAIAMIGESRKKELSSKMASLVLQVARRMQDDPGGDFDVEKMACHYQVSKDYFRHSFQQYIGTSYHEYLLVQRYNMAIRLLRETNLNIGAISDMCGFSALRLFTQFFKKRSGISPKDFREHTF